MEKNSRRILRLPSHRQIQRADLKGKNVMVRFDFNVPTNEGKVEDTRRIDEAIPTIRKILEKGAKKIFIITHFGRPTEQEKEFSLQPIAKILARKLNAVNEVIKTELDEKSPALKTLYEINSQVSLFENLRFDKREEENSTEFAKELAKFGDVFVQDAFANIHREHTSMVKIQEILPTYAGLLVEKEINFLFRILAIPERPFVGIIGGSKIEDKMPIIESLSKKCDAVLVGGMTANEWILTGQEKFKNVFLPIDGINKAGAIVEFNKKNIEEGVFDIGPQSILLFKGILSSSKTIFFNGNLGMTENKRFVHGTNEVVRFISKLKADKVVSGGNTTEVIDELGLQKSFTFISTGGGATSDLICEKKLISLEMLLR